MKTEKAILNNAAKEYQRELIKIAKKVQRGTKNSFRWLDMAERAKRQTERKYIDLSRNLFGWYNSTENRIIDAIEQVDIKLFGQYNSFGVHAGYCFTNDKLLAILNS